MSKLKAFYSKHPLLSHIILIFLTGAIILWGVLVWLDHWTMHNSTAIVPDIKNKTYSDAEATLASNRLSIEIYD
ncbi:MAG: hypothetical protein K2K22_04655, partial [Muribaculaceae bacterium]|nr:hypothetical protein [Muribaculaceae bacterium]